MGDRDETRVPALEGQKKPRLIIIVGTILLVAALGLQLFLTLSATNVFKMTGFFQTMAIQLFGAQPDQRYFGGELRSKFRDRVGDDKGPGSYEYPRAEAFQEAGSLDLAAYAVHEPVTSRVAFMPDGYYWQLDFTMAALGPAVIHAYIDIDGAESGSTESLDGCENLEFDPSHPWDYLAEIDVAKGEGSIQDASGEYSSPISVYVIKERSTVFARLPLSAPGLKRVLDGRPTWHYVTVAAWDDYSRGHVMPIGERSGMRQGGGALSRSSPRVYDYLAPKGLKQEDILSPNAQDPDALAALAAVEIVKGDSGQGGTDEARIAELKKQAKAETEAEAARAETEYRDTKARLEASGEQSIELAVAYFFLGSNDQSESCVDAILAKVPDDIAALSYKGLLVGMKAGQAKNVSEAVDLVNKAFGYLDKSLSEAMAKGLGPDTEIAYRNWINLAFGVPEFPFGKSESGARLCDELSAYYGRQAATAPKAAVSQAEYLMSAGLLYEQAKLPAKAETRFMQAVSIPGLPARLMLELAERGYL